VSVCGLAFTLGALTAGVALWRADSVAGTYTRVSITSGPIEPGTDTRADGPDVRGTGQAQTSTPEPTATSGAIAEDDAVRLLKMRRLEVPVVGVSRRQLRDSFAERRSGVRSHEAIDIMVPRGTPVRAVENGRVAKLFKSVAGGLTVYQFDPSEMFAYYYAHLDGYAGDLKEGQRVSRGDIIGYAGSSGNASEDAPHLHFAIFRLGPERRWWEGEAINPFPVLR
jgi:murein DD-endopeptidase MepM/ murein hydrolase activator NlpD